MKEKKIGSASCFFYGFGKPVRVSGRSDLEGNQSRGRSRSHHFFDFIFANYFTVVPKGEYENPVSWGQELTVAVECLWSACLFTLQLISLQLIAAVASAQAERLQVGEEGGATHEDDVGSDNSTEKKTDPKNIQELRSHFVKNKSAGWGCAGPHHFLLHRCAGAGSG